MSIWIISGIIFIAGAAGGFLNALITDNGFFLPTMKKASTGARIWRPGFLGNIVIGSFASVISWSLYGPLSSFLLFDTSNSNQNPNIPLSTLGVAVLVGIGGARWLTDAVDKNILKTAAIVAAEKADSEISLRIGSATPIHLLEIIEDMDSGIEADG